MKRGKQARDAVVAKRQATSDAAEAELEAKRADAAAMLGVSAKGYMERRKAKLEEKEMSNGALRIQANFRGRKERHDPGAEANVRRARNQNDPQVQATNYIKEHKLMALFELLGQSLVAAQPDDPRAFLAQQLTQLKGMGNPTSPLNFFTEGDVDVLFSMYDASRRGLTGAQCREALNAMGLDKVDVPAATARFDLAAFRALATGTR